MTIIQFLLVLETVYFTMADYKPWNHGKMKGNALLCDDSVCKLADDICCSCHCKASWEIQRKLDKKATQNLHIEYIDTKDNSVILALPEFNYSKPAIFIHRHGRLKAWPKNICDFTNIKILDLSFNRLQNINDIECLENLEKINLENNLLDHLSNSSFQNLTQLRNIKLANNQIKKIDPNVIAGESILKFDVSGNRLKTIDITNLVMDKLYCEINYENNKFQKIGNELNWKVNMSLLYGSGMVKVAKNPPMHFPNYEKLGFAVDQFPKLFKILRNTKFHFGANIFICDCRLEPILRYAHIWKPDYSFIFPNFPNFTCSNKGPNAGTNAVTFLDKRERDKLTCNLNSDDNCPSVCQCYDQPSRNQIVVNCNGNKLDKPEELRFMPKGIGHHLTLRFGNTGLQYLPWHDYMVNMSSVDLSNNSFENLEMFSNNVNTLKNLKELRIHSHNLLKIPKSFIEFDPNILILGETPIQCECQNVWIGDWRSMYNVNRSINPLLCQLDNRVLPIEDVSADFLECHKTSFQWTWLVALASVISVITLMASRILFHFRYEMHILFRSFRQKRRQDNLKRLFYDVYISYDVNESEVRQWILKELRTQLKKQGLNIYDTNLDTLPGSIRGEVISLKIARAKQILIVLSKAYVTGEDPYCTQEFKGAVRHYFRDKSKSLILINYDNIQTTDVSEPYMKAFIRLGKCVPFADRNENISRKIQKLLKPDGT